MINLKNYIIEKFKLSSKNITKYKYHPTTKEELKKIIGDLIEKNGIDVSLNDINTSKINDMSKLFYDFSDFNGDISKWDVSNVEDMSYMFSYSRFNGDISQWDVSKVKYMKWMFNNAKFNQDISDWDVSSVVDMSCMFVQSNFNQNIDKWKVNKDTNIKAMFTGNAMKLHFPKWYKDE